MRPSTAIASRFAALTAVIATAAFAGCGGGSDSTSTGEIPGGADPAKVQVIDDWASTLSEGDVAGAAAYFAIPSVAENGPALIHVRDSGDARLFNASLPCGATLVEADPEGEFIVATFRLTERPGPGTCGAGTGDTAKTAFVVEDGKIKEWRRVLEGGSVPPQGEGPAPGRTV